MRYTLLFLAALALAACASDPATDDGTYDETVDDSTEADGMESDSTDGTDDGMSGEMEGDMEGGTPFMVEGDMVSPLVFSTFMPSMESGEPNGTAVDIDTVALAGDMNEEGWYHADLEEGGFIDYQHLGGSDGHHVFLVRENGGGTLSQAGIVVLGVSGKTLTLEGFQGVENLRDYPVELNDGIVEFDDQSMSVAEMVGEN